MRKLTHVFWLCLLVPLLMVGHLARAQTAVVFTPDNNLATPGTTILCTSMQLTYSNAAANIDVAGPNALGVGDPYQVRLWNATTNTLVGVLSSGHSRAAGPGVVGPHTVTIPTGLVNGNNYRLRIFNTSTNVYVNNGNSGDFEFRNTAVSISSTIAVDATGNVRVCYDDLGPADPILQATAVLQGTTRPIPGQITNFEWRRNVTAGAPVVVSGGPVATVPPLTGGQINNITSEFNVASQGGYDVRITETRYGAICQTPNSNDIGVVFSTRFTAATATLTSNSLSFTAAGTAGAFAAAAPTNVTVCTGSTVQIAVSASTSLPTTPLPGTPWALIGPTGTVIQSGAYPAAPSFATFTPGANGLYTVVLGWDGTGVAPTGGCGIAAAFNITRVARPVVNNYIQTGLNPMCEGSTLTVQGTGANFGAGSTYQWYFNGAPITVGPPNEEYAGQLGAVLTIGTAPTGLGSSTSANTGPYFLRVTNGTCPSINETTLTVTVNPKPTGVQALVEDDEVCVGGTINFTATAASLTTTYTWRGPNGYTSNNQFPSIANATLAAGGVYSVTVGSAAGCTASAEIPVVVNPNPSVAAVTQYTAGTIPGVGPNVAPITQLQAACAGGTINLNATATGGTGALTYSWTGPSFTNVTQSPVLATANSTTAMNGVYTVRVTDAEGCIATATTSVAVRPLPAAQVMYPSGQTTEVCEGTTIKVDAAPFFMGYSWIVTTGPTANEATVVGVAGSNNTQRDPSFNVNVLNVSSTQVFFTVVVEANNGCRNASFLSTKVSNNPGIGTGVAQALRPTSGPDFCAGQNEVIEFTQTNITTVKPGDVIEYAWAGPNPARNNGSFLNISAAPNASNIIGLNQVTPEDGGVYTVTLRNNSFGLSCTVTASTSLSVMHKPSPTISTDPEICKGESVILNATTGIPASGKGVGNITYDWGAGAAIAPAIAPGDPGTTVANTVTVPHQNLSSLTVVYNDFQYNVNVFNRDPADASNVCSVLSVPAAVPPTANVRVFNTPTVSFSVRPGPYCTGDAVALSVSDGLDVSGVPAPLNIRSFNMSRNGTAIAITNNTFTSSAVAPATFTALNIAAMSLADAGTYTITVSNNSCTNTASTSLTIFTTPTATLTSNSAVCSGAPINLSAGSGLLAPGSVGVAASVLYTYTLVDGAATISPVINGNAPTGALPGTNTHTTTFTSPTPLTSFAALTYQVEVDNGGCRATATGGAPAHPSADQVTIVDIVRTPASIALAGPTTAPEYCTGTPLVLNIIAEPSSIDANTTYTITGPNGITVTGNFQSLIPASSVIPGSGGLRRYPVTVIVTKEVTDSGNYKVVVTNSKGGKSCSVENNVDVFIRQVPKPTATVPVNFICSGGAVSINVTDAAVYGLEQDNSAPRILWFLTDPTLRTVNPQQGPPSLNPVLPPDSQTPSQTFGDALKIGTYSLPLVTFDPFNVSSNQNTLTIENVQTGIGLHPWLNGATASNYGFIVTLNNEGCIAEAYANVTVVETPTVAAQIQVLDGAVVQATAPVVARCEDFVGNFRLRATIPGALNPSNVTFKWTGPAGFSSTQQSPVLVAPHSLARTGVYTVVVENISNADPATPAQMCSASATVSLFIGEKPRPVATTSTPKVCEGSTVTLSVADPVGGTPAWFLVNAPGNGVYPGDPNAPVTAGPNAGPGTDGQQIAVGQYNIGGGLGDFFNATSANSSLVMTNMAINAPAPLQPASEMNFGFRAVSTKTYTVQGVGDILTCFTVASPVNVVVFATPGSLTPAISDSPGLLATSTDKFGVCVDNAGPIVMTVRSATGSLSLTDPNTSYKWAGPNGFTSSTQQATVLGNITKAMDGVYTVSVFNRNSPECSATATVSLLVGVNPAPVITVATPKICEGSTVTLNVTDANNTGAALSWYVVNAPDFGAYPGNPFEPVTTGPNAGPGVDGQAIAVGQYNIGGGLGDFFNATSAGNSLVMTNFSINAPTPPPVFSEMNFGFRATMSAVYNLPGGITPPTGRPFLVCNTSAVANVAVFSGPGSVTPAISDTPAFLATVATDKFGICEGAVGPIVMGIKSNTGSLNLTDVNSAYARYKWAGPNGFTSTTHDATLAGPMTLAMDGVYTLTVYNENHPECSATATVSLLVGKMPKPVVTTTTPQVCSGATINLSVVDQANTGGTAGWFGVDPDGAGPLIAPNPSAPVVAGNDIDSDPFTTPGGEPDPIAVGRYILGASFEPFTVTSVGSNLVLGNMQTGIGAILTPGVAASVNYGFRVRYSAVYDLPGGKTTSDGRPTLVCTAPSNIQNIIVAETPVATASTSTPVVCAATNVNNTPAQNVAISLTSANGPALANDQTTFEWSSPGAIYTSSLRVPDPIAQPLNVAASGVWTVSVKNAEFPACSSTATVAVTIRPMPTASITVSPTAVCAGTASAFTIAATSGATGAWATTYTAATGFGPAPANGSGTGLGGNFNVTIPGSGTVNATITLAGCAVNPAAASVTIRATPLTQVAGGAYRTQAVGVCEGAIIAGAATTPAADANGVSNILGIWALAPNVGTTTIGDFAPGTTFAWAGPGGPNGASFTSSAQLPTLNNGDPLTAANSGTYTVTISNGGGNCTATATVLLTVGKKPQPVVTVGTPQICEGATITLSAVDNNTSFPLEWYVVNPNAGAYPGDPNSPVVTGTNVDSDPNVGGLTPIAIGNYNAGPGVIDNFFNASSVGATLTLNNVLIQDPATPNRPEMNFGFRVRVAGEYQEPTGNNQTFTCVTNSNVGNVVVFAGPGQVTASLNTGLATPTTVCEGATTDIAFNVTKTGSIAYGDLTYKWAGPAGFTASVRQPSLSAPITAAMNGVYTVTVSNPGKGDCSATATVSLFVAPLPQPVVTNTTPIICEGQPIVLNGSDAANTGAEIRWFMVDPGFFPYPGDPTAPIAGGTNVDTDPATPVLDPIRIGVYNFLPPLGELYDATSNQGTLNLINTQISFLGNVAQMNWGFRLNLRKTYNAQGGGTITCVAQSAITNVVVNAGPGNLNIVATPDAVCEGARPTGAQPAIAFTLTRSGTLPYADASFKWAGPGGFTASVRNPEIYGPATMAMNGVYSVTVTNPLNPGCSSTATVSVLVGKRPEPVVSTTMPTVCSGSTIKLNVADASGTGATPNWFLVQGPAAPAPPDPLFPVTEGTDVDSNPSTAAIDPIATGDYTINGSSFIPFSVLQNGATLEMTNAQTGLGVLPGYAPGLSPSVNYGYRVRSSAVYNRPNGGTLVCTGTSNIQNIVVAETPKPAASNSGTICSGTSLTNTGTLSISGTPGPGLVNEGVIYTWTSPTGTISTLPNAPSPLLTYSGANLTTALTGTWTLNVKNVQYPACQANATTVVTVNPTPAPTITRSASSVCQGNGITMTVASGIASAGSQSWTVTQGSTQITSGSNSNPTVGATLTPGSYSFNVTVTAAGCSNATSIGFTINANPLNGITGGGYNTAAVGVCEGEVVSIANTNLSNRLGVWAGGSSGVNQSNPSATGGFASGTTFTWAGPGGPGGAPFSSNSAFPTLNNGDGVTVANEGTYSVTIANSGSCSTTLTVFLKVGKKPVVTALAATDIICAGSSITLFGNDVAGTGGVGKWFLINSPGGGLGAYPGNPTSPVVTGSVYNLNGPDGSIQDGAYNLGTPADVFYANIVGSSLQLSNVKIGIPGFNLMNFGFQYGVAAVYDEPTGGSATFQCTTVSPIVNIAVSEGPSVTGLTVSGNSQCEVVNANPIVLNLSTNPDAGLSYSWAGPSNFTSTSQSPTVAAANAASAAQSGTYSVTVVNTAAALGCSTTATVAVTVNARPALSLSSNSPVCQGTGISITTTATGGAVTTWAWTNNAGAANGSSQNYSINTSAIAPGTYTASLTATTAAGCQRTASINFTVNATPFTNESSTAINTRAVGVCEGTRIANDQVSVTSDRFGVWAAGETQGSSGNTFNSSTTFTWAGPAGTFVSGGAFPTLNNGDGVTTAYNGTYTVTLAVGACTASQSVVLVVGKKPVVTAGPTSPDNICAGSAIALTATDAANTGGVGRWFLINAPGLGSFPGDPDQPVTNGPAANLGGPDGSIADGAYSVDGSPANQIFVANVAGSQLNLSNMGVGNLGTNFMNYGFQYGVAAVYGEPTGNSETFQCTTVSPIVNIAVYAVPQLSLSVSGNNQCAGTNVDPVQLQLTSTPAGNVSYSWAGPSAFTSASEDPTLASANSATTARTGVYSVTVVNTAAVVISCSSTATVSVTVRPRPVIAISGTTTICEGATLQLSASSDLASTGYTWSGPFGFGSNATNISVPGLGVGTYTYTLSGTAGNCSAAQRSVTVNVTANPLTGVASTGGNPNGYYAYSQEVCDGSTVFIGVSSRQNTGNAAFSAGTTFTWSGPNGYSSNAQAPAGFVANAASAGIYTVSVFNGSCGSTATMAVTVKALPVPVATPNPALQGAAQFCLDITGGASGPYSWRGPVQQVEVAPLTTTFNGPTFTAANPIPAGILSANTDATFVNSIKPSGLSSYVYAGEYTLNYTGPIPGIGQYFITYKVVDDQFQNVRFRSTEKNPCRGPVTADMAGIYTAYANGCSATVRVNVTTIPAPTVTASASPSTVTAGGNVGLSASLSNGPATGWAWAGPCGFTATTQNPSISGIGTSCGGTYSVTVTTAGGTASATVLVTVNPFIPPTPPTADLNLFIDSQSRRIVSGDNSYITVIVQNSGPNVANNVVVTVNLPTGFQYLPGAQTVRGVDSNPLTTFGNPSASGQVVTGTISSIPVGGQGLVKFYYRATGPVGYNPVVTGVVSSSSVVDNTTASDEVDVLIISTYGSRLSSGNESTEPISIKTYPNPSSDRVTIELTLDEPSAATLKMTDVTGRTVGEWKLDEETTQHKTEISIREYNSGMYYINAEAGTKRVVKKIVKSEK